MLCEETVGCEPSDAAPDVEVGTMPGVKFDTTPGVEVETDAAEA